MVARLGKLRPSVRMFDGRAVQPEKVKTDPFYLSAEYRNWREVVVNRAGRRCQAVDFGRRCTKAEPYHRIFADHVHEIRDGGAKYDPANGQALCGRHHTLKTTQARASRLSR